MKSIWDNIEKIGVILSLIISSIAIIISIKSCNDSDEALEISKKEFQSKRDLVLEAQSGYVYPGFIFKAFDVNQKLQRIVVHLPTNLSKKEIFVEPPEYAIYLSELEDSLMPLLNKKTKDYVNKNILNIPSILVPIIVVSNYVVGGENLWDTSVYNLEFSFQHNAVIESDSHLSFKNLMFVGRWAKESNYKKVLDEFWDKHLDGLLKNLDKM